MTSFPNVLLLTIDALRADRTSLHGYHRPTTPNLERLAEDAVVCERAFSLGPFTQSACVQMFTSTRPLAYGGFDAGATGRPETLFKRFQSAGYRTTALSTLHWVNRFFGYGSGLNEEYQLFTPNTLVGVAVAVMRSSLQGFQDGTIPEDAMRAVVEPVVAKLFDDAEEYCCLRRARARELAHDFPDSLLVNAGYNFARLERLIARHRRAFEADRGAYIGRHLSGIPKPHEWLAQEWRYRRAPAKLASELVFRAGNRLVALLDARLAGMREARFKHYVDAPTLADKTISLIRDRNQEKPFLLWAHFMDTHVPYVSGRGRQWYRQTPGYLARLGYPPDLDPALNFRHERPREPADQETVSALYDAAVLSTDEQIGRIVVALDEMGLSEDTIVAICGDHGEELGDHGDVGHYFLFYEHNVHTPMLFRRRGMPPQRIESLVTSLDLAPTVAALAGVAPASGWEGAPVTKDAGGTREHVIMETVYGGNCVFEHRPIYLAVRTETHKFIWKEYRDPRDDFSPDGPQLYDLVADPRETTNLYRPDHPVVKALNLVLARRLADMPEIVPERIVAAFGDVGRQVLSEADGGDATGREKAR